MELKENENQNNIQYQIVDIACRQFTKLLAWSQYRILLHVMDSKVKRIYLTRFEYKDIIMKYQYPILL